MGYRVVGGGCPTVGIAGRYTLGGGHSPLTSTHGLAADNVLEWEIVTAGGTRTTATPELNADLYLALSGGGGTFAVVVSMTTRMHRDDTPTGGVLIAFNASSSSSSVSAAADAFWEAVDRVHERVVPIVDSGAEMLGYFTNATAAVHVTAPGQTAAQMRRLIEPVVGFLADAQRGHGTLTYMHSVDVQRSQYEHFERHYGPLPHGRWQTAGLVTSRFLPRGLFVTSSPSSSSSSSSDIKTGELVQLYRKVLSSPSSEPGWQQPRAGACTGCC